MSAPLSRADLRALAKARCEDAQCLLANGRWSSAYYLSEYAVELALKARIASLFLSDAIPDKAFVNEVYTHNLNNLLKAAGLQAELTALQKTRPDLYANWGIAGGWSESSRYALWDSVAAHTLVGAIADPNDGVFTWLTQYWWKAAFKMPPSWSRNSIAPERAPTWLSGITSTSSMTGDS